MIKDNTEEEIDLIYLIKYLFRKRLRLLMITLISSFIGLIIGVVTPVEYQASTVFIAQENGSQSGMGGLSGLAAMAGVNIGASNRVQSLPPILYPEIVLSVPFQKELMNTFVTYGEDSITLYDYYTIYKEESSLHILSKYSIGLPFTIINSLKGPPKKHLDVNYNKRFISLSANERSIVNQINSSISLTIDDETKSVKISSNFPTALMAAEVGMNYFLLLQRFVTRFKIEKATEQYTFVKERYLEQRELVEKCRKEIAVFKDKNRNFSTAESQITLQKLTNDFNVIFSVYTELAKQLEQANLQVKQDTPVFTILQPISVPSNKNKPRMILYILFTAIFSSMIAIVYYSVQYSFMKQSQ
ncbi:hypothetical protein K5X82_14135 [Halosquirtibacter xylanolyticus]|uniref:Wzz/FepE/Etk N-terminal domain-containing protein n=1 Tax=Halosquirtibacter xylanolyticus TaxID=3374599 RepID=UPI003748DA8B|nr:hypothetical protein K5X82_14135 [Prolixibacteraceae bacterium]